MGAREPTHDGVRLMRIGRAVGYIGGAAASVVATVAAVASAWMLPVASGPLVTGIIVQVPAGSSALQVGQILEQGGLVRSAWVFAAVARLEGIERGLQAGFYRFRPDMHLQEVLSILSRGAIGIEQVTVPEGYTIAQIATLLERRGLGDAERFMELALDDRWLFGSLRTLDKPPGSLEGYLFPDTYQFAPGQPEEAVLRKMVARFVDRVVPLYERIGKESGLSLHQAVVLASIVEKEAMRDSERALISSVFHNRLRRGQPLQADPTLLYVLSPPPRKLSRADLGMDSPYNTYRFPGLPPTAISNPGLASIEAALRPAHTPYLYFVAKGDGTHVFSRTFQEHVMARRRLPF